MCLVPGGRHWPGPVTRCLPIKSFRKLGMGWGACVPPSSGKLWKQTGGMEEGKRTRAGRSQLPSSPLEQSYWPCTGHYRPPVAMGLATALKWGCCVGSGRRWVHVWRVGWKWVYGESPPPPCCPAPELRTGRSSSPAEGRTLRSLAGWSTALRWHIPQFLLMGGEYSPAWFMCVLSPTI